MCQCSYVVTVIVGAYSVVPLAHPSMKPTAAKHPLQFSDATPQWSN